MKQILRIPYGDSLDLQFVDPYGVSHIFTLFDETTQHNFFDGIDRTQMEAIGLFRGHELKWVIPYAGPISREELQSARINARDDVHLFGVD